jgi:hypothetical protein
MQYNTVEDSINEMGQRKLLSAVIFSNKAIMISSDEVFDPN